MPLIKAPLVGLEIIDFESSATKFTKKQISKIKAGYAKFIEKALQTLAKKGCKAKSKKELLKLCKRIGKIIWRKFSYDKITLLTDSMQKKKLHCCTSSFIFADILNQFDVKSKLVALPRHTILHVEKGNISFYLETTSKLSLIVYSSKEKLRQKYQTVFGECDFTAENFFTYNSRGIAKSELKDRRGALRDYSRAIKLNPKYAEAYNNRGIERDAFGDYEGAINDFTKAIQLNPKNAAVYYYRGLAKSMLEKHRETIEDYNKAIELGFKNMKVYRERGNAKRMLKDYDGAIEDYTEAIMLSSISDLQKANEFKIIDAISLRPRNGSIKNDNLSGQKSPP